MKTFLSNFWIVVILLFGSVSCDDTDVNSNTSFPKENVPENILFIGNSFTYWNDGVDYHVQRLADGISDIQDNYVTRAAQGKFHLYTHWEDSKTLATLNSKKWDKVILQEYSSGPARETKNFFKFGNLWKDKLKRLNPKTELFLYSTWGYKNTIKMVDSLAYQYNKLGDQIGALAVPVGLMWENLKDKIDLYSEDGAHPNRNGTFITACLFYEYIYEKDVTKCTHVDESIPEDLQQKLKQWAHNFHIQYEVKLQ
jgi:Domain of unknown function (DUF4886)